MAFPCKTSREIAEARMRAEAHEYERQRAERQKKEQQKQEQQQTRGQQPVPDDTQ